MTGTPFVRHEGDGERRRLGETVTDFLATGDETGGVFALVDERAVRGEAVPLHRHPDDVESFYVLEGELSFFLDSRPGIRTASSAFVHVPPGATHGFRVESETARYLILTTPRHGEFYRAITRPDGAGHDAEPPPDIAQACRDFGIEFVGPLPDA